MSVLFLGCLGHITGASGNYWLAEPGLAREPLLMTKQ